MQLYTKIFLVYCIFSVTFSNTQSVFHQDIFNGGVTGDGYNPIFSSESPNFVIHIENGSTIRNAFFFCIAYNSPLPKKAIFNGTEIELNSNTSLNNSDFLANNGIDTFALKIIIVDVRHLINPNQNTYSFIPPNQVSPKIGGFYSSYYLYVSYENPVLPAINSTISLNNIDANAVMNYNFSSINPINLNKPVGLALNAGHFCDTIQDGSYIKINNSNIGLLGGIEYNTNVLCSGVSGSFYYQSENLFGLGNDTPTNTMSGSDALANISPYINNNTNFDVRFEYQSNTAPRSNPVFQLFLTYVSNCDPFDVTVTPDTTTCFNSPLQLHATGGSRYEWQPATGLSCANCPNPIVSTDSSRFYTVRIWNNDTCSVVRSVKVNVNPLPSFSSIQFTASECGDSTGTLIAKSNQPVQYSIDGSVPKTSGIFNQLSSGFHTVSILDSNGCSKDSVIFIPEIISVNALFVANPPSGGAPLAVDFANQSTNASNYEWFVDGVSQGSSFSNYLFDSTGVYTTTLIAWQNNPTCADTFTVHIHVYDSLMVQVPNVFTPNQDGNNDLFGITTNIPVFIDFQIFNRWGNVMSSGQNLKSQVGIPFTPLWNGEDAVDGTYFYQITVRSQITEQNLEVKADGFVHLVR
ncbi:MAG: gliding motility-associated C-terminal domain-containing protein [Crocinitomicaceae bacterium]|nr:gliding motility-associated C-terminal domain-containing protein [Crocinitomicaceae bacterium]